MKLTALAVALALGLAGCTAIAPLPAPAAKPTTPDSAVESSNFSDLWDRPDVFTEGKSSVVLITPLSIPDSVRAKKLSVELEPGATVADLVAVLGKLGLTIIISDPEAAKKEFFLPHFKGTVGSLLSSVTRATDTWFTWHDGTIVVSTKERIGITVPQEAGFGEQLGRGLDAMGVKDKTVSWQAGMAVVEVSPSQFGKVKQYLERYTANAAVVTLQLAIVNVNMNQNVKQGVDWDKLTLSSLRGGGTQSDLLAWRQFMESGKNSLTNAARPVIGTGTNGTNGPTAGTPNAPPTEPTTAVKALSLASGALSGAVFRSGFSFEGMFNFLQTYGVAETKQSVMLKTLAGNKVELKSLTQIPYVSEITNTTVTGGSTSNSAGSSKTAKADDGITVEMTPTFDAAANSVTIDFKLSIKAVLAFNELNAGNSIGTLTQPTTAERSFTDTLRVRPGSTVVVGGLTYDSVNNSKGAPVFLRNTNLESQSLKVDRQSTFIVLRPTVMKLGQVLSREMGEENPELDLLPKGDEPAPQESRIIKRSAGGTSK